MTAKHPCRPDLDESGEALPPSSEHPCRPTIDDRAAYVVFRQHYGPEFPHSQPCCNPRPFSKEPRTSPSWAIYDADTGKFLGGGRLG